MRFKLYACLLITLFSFTTASFAAVTHPAFQAETNYFQFSITQFKTDRQGGQTLNVYVKFSYKPNPKTSDFIDYRLMRNCVLQYLQPTPDLPAETFWEPIAIQIGHTLMKQYPIAGVSVFIEVLDNPDGSISEPGDHGPIFTMGAVEPISATVH